MKTVLAVILCFLLAQNRADAQASVSKQSILRDIDAKVITNPTVPLPASELNALLKTIVNNFVNTSELANSANNYFDDGGTAKTGIAYRNTNNVLSGLIDPYTSEAVTYSKVINYSDGSAMNDSKIDGVIYRKKGSEYFKRNFTGPIGITWFGAKPGDGIDDKMAIQKAVDFAARNGAKITIGEGVWDISDEIVSPAGFNQPIIEGAGAKFTRINFNASLSGKAIFVFKGGSGVPNKGRIQDITFSGKAANTVGVRFEDANMCEVADCVFDNLRAGVQFVNKTGFTEFCVATNCDFTESCLRSVEYINSGSSHVSFNGSGILGCRINQSRSDTEPKILINKRCTPYNAPLDFQVWTRSKAPVIRSLATDDAPANFHGTITIEPIFGVGQPLVDTAYYPVYILGSMMSNSTVAVAGKAIFCDAINMVPGGGISVMPKQSIEIKTVAPGNNLLHRFTIGGSNQAGMSFIVTVTINGYQHQSNYAMLVSVNLLNDGGSVKILNNNIEFDLAKWGDWNFWYDHLNLYCSNPRIPRAAEVRIQILPIGSNFQAAGRL